MQLQKLGMERLNSMGEASREPPMSNEKQRQVGILYGHEGSGKVYNYTAGQNVRAGDIVTPMVTHHQSGKEYKTLGRIVYTRDAEGDPAQNTKQYLKKKNDGIELKTLGATNQTNLPGFMARKAADPNFKSSQWAQEAKDRKEQQQMRKLSPMGEPDKGGDKNNV